MIKELKIAISGTDNRKLFKDIYEFYFSNNDPTITRINGQPAIFSNQMLSNDFLTDKIDLFFQWENHGYLSILKDEIVFFGFTAFEIDPLKILSLLEILPFEIASFGTLYPEWLNPISPYEAPSFGNFHLPHGWACAIKKKGFERIVSERWIDFGPWKQYFGKEDTQLIQFHELDISSEEALKQARPGHLLMGISDDGGFIQKNYVYKYDNKGLYDPIERKIKIIVHGAEITNRQLLDACAVKSYYVSEKDLPVDNIAYIFMDVTEAQKRLHSIWLHGLECRAIINGNEICLSDSYNPLPQKPIWASK